MDHNMICKKKTTKKKQKKKKRNYNSTFLNDLITLLLLNITCPVLTNSIDPDQLASEEANWSGSALFVIKCMCISIKNPDQVIWLAGN